MAKGKRLSAVERDRTRRMQWWHRAKFGMFIHWGLYSLLGRHEWAMEQEGIPVAEFEQSRYRVRFRGLPAKAPDEPVSVLALRCAGIPKQDMLAVRTGMKRGKP